MARDIDLTSPQWTALVFEGRNKEYGAYEMRNDSSDRHLKALLIITIVGLAAVYLPNLIQSDVSVNTVNTSQITPVDLSNVAVDKVEDIEMIPVAPPPLLISTDRFVPLVVVKDELVDPNDRLATQIELTESTAQISVATVIGDEQGTLDIRDAGVITGTPPAKQDPPREFAEQMPRFPGEAADLMKWLSNNIKYPALAIERHIQGRVIVRFVVRTDGSIDDVTVVKSLEPSCDKEAIRAVKNMPNWIPGRQNGSPVSVYYTLPIQFKLQNQ